MKNECLHSALQELEAAGIRDVEHANGGKHVQIRWRVNGGSQRIYTIPATPSDWRASRNARADIRRLLREDGVITEVPKSVTTRKLDRTSELERRVRLLEARIVVLEQALGAGNLNGNGRAGDIIA